MLLSCSNEESRSSAFRTTKTNIIMRTIIVSLALFASCSFLNAGGNWCPKHGQKPIFRKNCNPCPPPKVTTRVVKVPGDVVKTVYQKEPTKHVTCNKPCPPKVTTKVVTVPGDVVKTVYQKAPTKYVEECKPSPKVITRVVTVPGDVVKTVYQKEPTVYVKECAPVVVTEKVENTSCCKCCCHCHKNDSTTKTATVVEVHGHGGSTSISSGSFNGPRQLTPEQLKAILQ